MIIRPYARKRNKYGYCGHTRCVPTAESTNIRAHEGRDKIRSIRRSQSRPYNNTNGYQKENDYPQSPPTRKRNGTLGALPQPPHTFWHCPKKYAKRSRNDDASLLRRTSRLSLRNSPALLAGSNSRSLLMPRCSSPFNAHHLMFQ